MDEDVNADMGGAVDVEMILMMDNPDFWRMRENLNKPHTRYLQSACLIVVHTRCRCSLGFCT